MNKISFTPETQAMKIFGVNDNKRSFIIWNRKANYSICFSYLSDTCPVSWKDRLKIKFEQRKRNPNIQGPAEFLIERTCDSYYAEYGNSLLHNIANRQSH